MTYDADTSRDLRVSLARGCLRRKFFEKRGTRHHFVFDCAIRIALRFRYCGDLHNAWSVEVINGPHITKTSSASVSRLCTATAVSSISTTGP